MGDFGERHSRGFSLIELVMVMAVLSILMRQGLPAIADYWDQAALRRAAVDLHQAAQMSRSEAIKRNIRTELRVSDSGWEIHDVSSAPSVRLSIGSLDPRTRASAQTVRFASNGRTFPAGSESRIDLTQGSALCQPGSRCMAVRVGSGGAARVCNPLKTAGLQGACS